MDDPKSKSRDWLRSSLTNRIQKDFRIHRKKLIRELYTDNLSDFLLLCSIPMEAPVSSIIEKPPAITIQPF